MKKPIVISISNQKGGVGKTTTALCVCDVLREKKKKVLLVDMDPQCNATETYRAVTEDTNTMFDVLRKECTFQEAIQEAEGGTIVPNDRALEAKEVEFVSNLPNYFTLGNGISALTDYDYVIIDTPPNLSFYTTSSWMASDYIIIPVAAEKFSMDGLASIIKNINDARKNTSPNLNVLGIIQTKYDQRNTIDREIFSGLPDQMKDFGIHVFKQPIRTCQDVKNAQGRSESMLKRYPSCNASQDYRTLVKEMEKEIKKYEK